MSDTAIFVFGAAVFTIATTGAWLFVYSRYFRPLYVRQNNRNEARVARVSEPSARASGSAVRPRA